MATTVTEEHERAAYRLGEKRAQAIIATGGTRSDAPLSGEWAGEPTPTSIAVQLGLSAWDLEGEGLDAIADKWCDGYHDKFDEEEGS